MKKVLLLLCLLFLMVGCTKAPVESEVELKESPGKYQIFNSLGEKIKELYLYETGSDKGNNRVGDNGLDNGKYILLTAEGTEETKLTLEYVSESGGTGKFETLNIEEAPINILAPDARTGSTILEFAKAEGTGVYDIYNLTGGTVTELYLYESGTDPIENYAGEEGLVNGTSVQVTITSDMDKTWCLSFKADNGEEGLFETLHIEEAPITLLSKDARTGATAISFTQPE